MAAARAAVQPQPNPPMFAWLAMAAGVLVGAVLCLLHLPGVVAVAVAVLVGSRLYPPPQLTGKPDSSTRMPTAASPYEQQMVSRHARWNAAGRAALLPSKHWVPGRDPHLTWLAAVGVGLACAALPATHPATVAANVVFGFNLACSLPGALRQAGRDGIPLPGAKLSHLKGAGGRVVPAILGGLMLGGGLALALAWLSPDRGNPLDPQAANRWLADAYLWLMTTVPDLPEWVYPPLGGSEVWWRLPPLAAGLAVAMVSWLLAGVVKEKVLSDWRALVAGRAEWAPRWEQVKAAGQNPPELIGRTQVGRAQVDLFSCSAAVPSETLIRQQATVAATFGTGGLVVMLTAPALDNQGQEVPLTRHPTRFRVVFWPDGLPSVAEFAGDEAEARLILDCAMQLASPIQPAPLLDQLVLISTQPDAADGDLDGDGKVSLRERLAKLLGRAPEPPPDPVPAAWVTTWTGVDGTTLRFQVGGALGARLGCPVVGDHRAANQRGILYLGDLSGQVLLDATKVAPLWKPELQKKVAAAARSGDPLAELDAMVQTALTQLGTEDVWLEAWRASLKMNANPPTIHHDFCKELVLSDGTKLQVTTFLFRHGQSMADYAHPDIEAKLATALGAKQFVNVAGLVQRTKPGQAPDRHPMAIRVVTSQTAVPIPSKLAPRSPDMEGPLEVLAGHVNKAFTDAKLARPEVYQVRCLTKPDARGHIWSLQVRLYDGVTLDEVRKKADKLRQAMGCEWLRVAPDRHGCRIVCGAHPARLPEPMMSKPDRVDVVGLDWDQAWIDAGVVSTTGHTPSVVDSGLLPDNPQVQRIVLSIPAGLSFAQLKMARSKLETATQNGFIDLRESKEKGAGYAEMLVAKVSPLRFPEPMRWDVERRPERVPFATGIEGAPVEMVLKDQAHFLVVGTTGGGKTAAAQVLLTGALLSGADCAMIDIQKFGADFAFAQPYCNGWATSLLDAAALFEALYAEVRRRAELNGRYGVGSVLELPEEVRPRQQFVFADEFFGMIAATDRPSPKMESDPALEAQRLEELAGYNARKRIAYLTGRIAAEARSAGFHLVVMTQKLTRDMIPNSLADLKVNLNRIGLGKMGPGDRMSAFREPDRLPELGSEIPPGRGIFEPISGEARVVQFWYAPQSELTEHLEAALQPVEPEAMFDVEPFRTDPTANAAFIVTDDDEFDRQDDDVDDDDDDEDVPVEVVDLGVVNLDLVIEPVDDDDLDAGPQRVADDGQADWSRWPADGGPEPAGGGARFLDADLADLDEQFDDPEPELEPEPDTDPEPEPEPEPDLEETPRQEQKGDPADAVPPTVEVDDYLPLPPPPAPLRPPTSGRRPARVMFAGRPSADEPKDF